MKIAPKILIMIAATSLASCTMFPEGINIDPNEVTDDQMQANNYKIGSNVRSLQGLVIPVEEHMYQFNESLSGGPFAGYIATTVDTWEAKFETFNPSADWRRWPFGEVITNAYAPYRNIINGTDDPVAHAFAKLFKVAVMHRVTDSYGPIPYSALEGSDEIYVSYDKQEDVYSKMFAELDEAIAVFRDNLTLAASAWSKFDAVYYGNISQWLKYANSLKLRMAMRLSYVMPDLARQYAADAIAGGVIETNADNAAMHAAENRTTLIYNDWADHRVAADIICYMNGYQDPRREKMFTTVEKKLPAKPGEEAQVENVYVGVRRGRCWSKADMIAKHSNLIVTQDTPYLWMNAAEVTFLRAEYELRWGSEATAKELYEKAVTLSFEEKGVKGAADYLKDTESVPVSSDYSFSDITIAWQTAGDAAGGELSPAQERNLERIITQKWIAIFPLGVEAWSEHRRTGYPDLMPIEKQYDLSSGTVNPEEGARRLPYPVEEYQLSRANVEAAITLLDGEASNSSFNGDKMGTRVWWDCKPF